MIRNIAEKFTDIAQRLPDKTGVIEAKTGNSFSFGEINSMSDMYAHYFSSKGLSSGHRVILMVTPSADFISLTFALFKIGVTIILIDPGMGYKNLLRCIARVKPDGFVGIPKARLFSRIFRKPFRSVRYWFCCGNSLGILGTDIRKSSRKYIQAGSFPVYTPREEDLAAIIFTTGSTGPPKGVRYEHQIFASQLKRVHEYYGIDESHTDQPAFPLFALFSAALGACSVIPDMDPTRPARVDPVKFIRSLEKYNVTYSFGSPAIWNTVSRYCVDKGVHLPGLQKVLMAGAPVPGDLLQRVRSILPEECQIFTPYGATESLPIVSIEAREILESTWDQTRKGQGTCVGRPLPGIEIKIIAITDEPIPELRDATPVENGRIGEILVRGDVVTRAYENNQTETALAKIYDGSSFWHRMGDTGYVDDLGRLWFCGRKAHRVITDKKTMFTIPCEAIVNEHPMVFRSALVGITTPASAGCQEPVMIVEPMKEFSGDTEQLLEEVKKLAAKSKLTENIAHFLVHDDFPVDIRHNAKIFREKLAIWAEKQINGE